MLRSIVVVKLNRRDVQDRFERAIALDKQLRKIHYLAGFGVAERPATDWSDRRVREVGANMALDVANDPFLKSAFEHADLDPSDPFSWRKLLKLLAAAHFGPDRRRGPKLKWTAERWNQLLSAFDKAKQGRPSANDSEIAKKIASRFPDEFGHSAGTVRRNLQKARDPKFNQSIDECAEIIRPIVEAEARKLGIDLSVKKLRGRSRQLAITALSKGWWP